MIKNDTRKIYDTTDERYLEDQPFDFKAAQEFLANAFVDDWEDESVKAYEDIMNASTFKELEGFASGLGYILEEEVKCKHKSTQTIIVPGSHETYTVCLYCGEEL